MIHCERVRSIEKTISYMCKRDQKRVPEGVEFSGSFWGCFGTPRPRQYLAFKINSHQRNLLKQWIRRVLLRAGVPLLESRATVHFYRSILLWVEGRMLRELLALIDSAPVIPLNRYLKVAGGALLWDQGSRCMVNSRMP